MGCEPNIQNNCSSGCCGGQRKSITIGDIPHHPDDAGSRCSTPEPEEPQEPQEDPNNPSCCQDKPSPCCDVSCLDRIALRECEKGLAPSPGDAASKFLPSTGCQGPDGNPCDQHRRSTRAKYATTLEALGCICRALIALGQESCCAPPNASSLGRKRRSTESSRSILRTSLDSCCKKGSTSSVKRRSTSSKGKGKACSSSCCGTSKASVASTQCAAQNGKPVNSGGCCKKLETVEAVEQHASSTKDACSKASTSSKGCCGEPKVNSPSTIEGCCSPGDNNPGGCDSSSGCCSKPRLSECAGREGNQSGPETCNAGCCSKPERPICAAGRRLNKPNVRSDGCCSTPGHSACSAIEEKAAVATMINPAIPDPEKGVTGKEHVVLSISGMTCTGCETKIKRTLSTLPSVQNLKTSLVLSRAEFDLNVGIQTFDEVLKHLQRTTEFKFEKITNKGSHVDIIVPNASQFMQQDWPHGVTEVTMINEETVNVAFDAKIVGARDLLNHGWGRPINLAPPRPDPTLMAGNKHVRQMGWMTILSIILTIPVLVLAWAPIAEREIAYGSASLALATIVQVVIAGPFYPKALKALFFSRIIEMDLLIVLSTSAAYIFSVVAFGYLVAGQPLATSGGGFFETSTLLVTLIMVGRYVAALARQKAIESISLRSLQTPTAILVDESGLNEEEVDVRLLQYGDIFKVLPDSKIPTDGTVISGSSEVDESMLTGESIPVDKSFGSTVIAGSVNASGTLFVKLTRLPADNTISSIAGMVDQAKLSKPKIQDIADRVASYFVPVVVALTIITFVIWVAVGTAVRNQSGSRATTEAILYAITVLIVSCPCAIGLAVPMVIVIASGVAAERGIIFKAADSIEVAYKASHIIFDKTGTLTQGKLAVAVEHIESTGDVTSMSLLLGLIGSNKHPISAAVTAHLKAQGITPSTVTDTKILTGKGVEGSLPGTQTVLRAGNSRWLNLSSNPQVKSVLDHGYTAFCFTINDLLVTVFGLEDSLRPDALETVTRLQTRGIVVHILSGDDDEAVHSIARQLHITAQNVRSRCTPADKQAYIQTVLTAPHPSASHGEKTPTTVFIGDGTNDAVALATATVGVHMNQETGSDIAKSAADVVLMRPSLLSVLTMIKVSEKAVRRIRFNFAWSFVYNLFAILLGAGAFVNARIPPEFAGLGELVSVLPVVVAAVLLRWARV